MDSTKSIFRWYLRILPLKRFGNDFCLQQWCGAVLRVFDEDEDGAIYKINPGYPNKYIVS